jgi:hypothetical protein
MTITKVQKEALSKTPLFLCQDEVNLNRMVWSDNLCTKDFRRSTVDSLMNKGLLQYKVHINGQDEVDQVVLTKEAKELGYVDTL